MYSNTRTEKSATPSYFSKKVKNFFYPLCELLRKQLGKSRNYLQNFLSEGSYFLQYCIENNSVFLTIFLGFGFVEVFLFIFIFLMSGAIFGGFLWDVLDGFSFSFGGFLGGFFISFLKEFRVFFQQ